MEPLKIVHISTMNCPDDAGYETPCWVCGHPYDWGACYLPRLCPRCGADPAANSEAELMDSVRRFIRSRYGKEISSETFAEFQEQVKALVEGDRA
ncbi:hypothetical protein [Thermus phage TSP4]|nr:hypothetical protein [Thermus phage TSP4]